MSTYKLGVLLLALLLSHEVASTTCSKFYKNACVCNDPDPCPLIEAVGEVGADDVIIYKTGEKSKDRLTRYEYKFASPTVDRELEEE